MVSKSISMVVVAITSAYIVAAADRIGGQVKNTIEHTAGRVLMVGKL